MAALGGICDHGFFRLRVVNRGSCFPANLQNLNFTDSKTLDTKTQLWKAVWTGKQFWKTWTTMPMESGHTEL